MIINDLPHDDKPREKALSRGIGTLTDAELLAIMLRTGLQGKNVVEVSQEILALCGGSLARLAQMTPGELCRLVPGIGPAKAITLVAGIELGLRCHGQLARDASERESLRSSQEIYTLMLPQMERLRHEEFWVLMLNRANRVESRRMVSQGGMAATVVDVRLLMKSVIDAQACGIALVHNHPSGNPQPSAEDDRLTRRIVEAACLLDIRVLDHLIVTAGAYYSYNDEGRL